jgi:hypothetical protein
MGLQRALCRLLYEALKQLRVLGKDLQGPPTPDMNHLCADYAHPNNNATHGLQEDPGAFKRRKKTSAMERRPFLGPSSSTHWRIVYVLVQDVRLRLPLKSLVLANPEFIKLISTSFPIFCPRFPDKKPRTLESNRIIIAKDPRICIYM